ncbi:hypothetical protein [Corynebacterium glutamicum]|uniref:beta-sandwich lipoprotein n=1 Tax=Corynebacterium glutamicum TaxID=1718 RepID=UPI001B8B6A34|nr:hypothetical protein [Corynebacterium glutamicum]
MKLRKTLVAATAAITAPTLAACGTQADRASHNLSREADNFNIPRRVVMINTITDQPLMEIVGYLSINSDNIDGQLEITVKNEDGSFKKHFIGLSPTITYTLEDLAGTDISPYRYQINYLPEAIIPIELVDASDSPAWEGDGR